MRRDGFADRHGTGQVIRFQPRAGARRSPVEDIGKYERSPAEPDDYRHRMLVNVLGLGFCILLAAAGIWLATKIAELRRDQDCVLAGRRNCAQISIVGNAVRYP
jgi:hypothetical protein